MKPLNKFFLLFLFFLISIISCTQKRSKQATFYSSNNKIIVEGYFYVTEKESPYFYIEDKKVINTLSDIVIDSIQFSFNNSIYMAKPIRLMFSNREGSSSDFFFPVDNYSKKIILDEFNGRKMFTLASNETDLLEVIDITPELLIEEK